MPRGAVCRDLSWGRSQQARQEGQGARAWVTQGLIVRLGGAGDGSSNPSARVPGWLGALCAQQ